MTAHYIIGVDEVGRGPLLGDVVAAAVILPNNILNLATPSASSDGTTLPLWQADDVAIILNHPLSRLTDSKKLSEKTRETLVPVIRQTAHQFAIAKIPPQVIDDINILQATMLAMQQTIGEVVKNVIAKQPDAHFTVVIDGNRIPDLAFLGLDNDQLQARAVVKGDSRHAAISAASVLAKVSRDHDMLALAARYPAYHIDKHKGYPTAAHLAALAEYGILPEHRRSFAPVKRLLTDLRQ